MKKRLKFILSCVISVLTLAACAAPQQSSGTSSTTPSKAQSSTAQSSTAQSSKTESVASKNESVESAVVPPNSDKYIHTPEQSIKIEGAAYELTFFDDFIGTELDKSKWHLAPQREHQDVGGKWNNSCTSLDGNGNLVLTAKLDENKKPISGGIYSFGKFSQAQGYFECRARLQKAPGFWSAFWLMGPGMGNNDNNGTAEDGIEIDIMESNSIFMKDINNALHWDGYGSAHKKTAHSNHGTNCYDGEYHTFSLLWTDTAYIFYIDGKESFRTQKGYGNYPGNCKDPCFMLLSVEFGSWAGQYDATMLPDNVAFDYVKVYQKVK